jgi:hypothetical protein
VVDEHLVTLHRQVARIIGDGIASGEFKVADPEAAAAAVLSATLRFHHPHHVRASAGADGEEQIRAVLRLVLAGLRAGVI